MAWFVIGHEIEEKFCKEMLANLCSVTVSDVHQLDPWTLAGESYIFDILPARGVLSIPALTSRPHNIITFLSSNQRVDWEVRRQWHAH